MISQRRNGWLGCNYLLQFDIYLGLHWCDELDTFEHCQKECSDDKDVDKESYIKFGQRVLIKDHDMLRTTLSTKANLIIRIQR